MFLSGRKPGKYPQKKKYIKKGTFLLPLCISPFTSTKAEDPSLKLVASNPADGFSHSIMISAFCRGGLLEEAKQLARDFEATYDKYDLVLLNNLLRAYCKAGDMKSVMQMLKKMDELAISPDRKTFHILTKYYCKEKLYQLAYRMVEEMHSKGHPLDEVSSICLSPLHQLSSKLFFQKRTNYVLLSAILFQCYKV